MPTPLKTHHEHVAEQLARDPAYRERWERTALARAVAIAVIEHRSRRQLTQTALGAHLGMSQPQVARIESGEVNPSMDTLMHLSGALGIEFTIDVRPAGQPSRLVNRRAHHVPSRAEAETGRVSVLVAATA